MLFKWVPKTPQCTCKCVRALGAWIETFKKCTHKPKMTIFGVFGLKNGTFFIFADLEWPIVAGYGRRHEMSFKWVPKACQCTGKYVRALGAWIETPKNGCKTRKMAILGQKSHIAEFSVAGNVPYGCPPHPKNFFRSKKFPKCLQKKFEVLTPF